MSSNEAARLYCGAHECNIGSASWPHDRTRLRTPPRSSGTRRALLHRIGINRFRLKIGPVRNSCGAQWERIVAQELDHPLRVTGQMFFDGSHRPCVGEEGRPRRISVWEIHPVYGIDVCKKKSLTSCRVNVADDWKT